VGIAAERSVSRCLLHLLLGSKSARAVTDTSGAVLGASQFKPGWGCIYVHGFLL